MNDTPTPMPTVGAISPTPAPSVTAATPTTTTAPSAPTPTATTAPLLDDAQPVGPTTPVTVNQNGGSVEPYVTFKNTGPTTWHSFVTNYEVTCSAGGKIIGAILISGDIAPQQTLTAGVSMSVPSPLIATTYMVSCSMAEDVPQMNGYPVMTDFGTAMSLKFTITHATWVDGETTPYCNSQSSWTEYTASAGAVSCSGGLVFRESGGLTPRLVYTGESSSVNLNGSVVSIHVSFSSPGADNWVKFMVHASGTNYCMVDGYEIRGDGYYRLYYTTSSCAEVDGSWTPFLTTPSDYSLQITASGNIINFGINGFFVTSATIPTPIYSGGYLALSAGGTSGSSADISVSDLGIYNTFYGTTTWVMV